MNRGKTLTKIKQTKEWENQPDLDEMVEIDRKRHADWGVDQCRTI